MSGERETGAPDLGDLPIIAYDMPVMFEDRGQHEMGESSEHTESDQILALGLQTHLEDQPDLRTFSNLNWHYHPTERKAYVSPDLMVVRPRRELPRRVRSYRTRRDGPAPLLCIEILSRRSAQQQDLTTKPEIFAQHHVAEYILVDGSGEFLPQRLLLRRLQPNGRWVDEQDADGGVTSALGFRIVIEPDGLPRVINARTGRRYLRPREAEQARREAVQARRAEEEARQQAEAAEAARQAAEERNRQLEAELARLRRPPEGTP
jgi:Uma2 family endonuclease